jgi:hypothetical protein
MKNKDAYTSMRNSLDSLRDVALAEIRLIESEDEKTKFADFITKKVIGWLDEIADERRDEWAGMNDSQIKKYQTHAELLSLNHPSAACPPGFIEIDGICVPI